MEVIESLQETTGFIRAQSSVKPKIGLVLGSGLGAFVNEVEVDCAIEYGDIPHFNAPTVDGHSGRLIMGHINELPVAILQGRVHFYEGHSMEKVVYPMRTLSMLGVESVVLTNSAGGLDPNMSPGDFMVIEDHINMMGVNPLMGPNIQHLGPRFPDMTEAYDKALTEKLCSAMDTQKIKYWKGIYCGVSGPAYETPAEVRFLQMIGGKAVGMSTVPECIAANHMGLRVCAVSCITNPAAGLSKHKLTHEEVTERAQSVEKKFCLFLSDFLKSYS